MMHFSLFPLVIPVVLGSSLQLNLLSTANASSLAPNRTSTLNATRLTTHNNCFDRSEGHDLVTTKSDCEHALDTLVNGKSLMEIHVFGYASSRVTSLTDRLPVEAQYGTCNIALLTFDLDNRITMTYAELYAELLGPNGVLKDCLGPDVPADVAFGGQTAVGPGDMLVADVRGQPYRSADHKNR